MNKSAKTVLCVYATRQIDSNLFMSSTVFRGLQEAGYKVYMVFAGTDSVISDFKKNYSKYFDDVFYCRIGDSWLRRVTSKKPLFRLAYSYYRHFIADGFSLPDLSGVSKFLKNRRIDTILSFIPPILSGRLAIAIRSKLNLRDVPLIQFWTDPLSLGRCDSIKDIPRTRFIHKYHERKLLSYCDKAVFWFKLLYETEKELHPQYAARMIYSDVSYIPRESSNGKNTTKPITIGLFGAYPSSVRNIRPLLESIKELKDIHFIIRGDGDVPFDISNISNLDLEAGRLPLAEIEKLEYDCDILLSLSSKNGIAPGGKTFYYASYAKPIIHIADGLNGRKYNEYLEELEGRYITCMNNKEEIIGTIRNTVKSLPDFALHIPERMNAAVIARKIIEE